MSIKKNVGPVRYLWEILFFKKFGLTYFGIFLVLEAKRSLIKQQRL